MMVAASAVFLLVEAFEAAAVGEAERVAVVVAKAVALWRELQFR